MNIRPINIEDTKAFFKMMSLLDEETQFMMYEPGERERTTNEEELGERIKSAISTGDYLMIAEDNDKNIAGYIWAERGTMNRIRHTAYIIIGIRESYQRQGIGTRFFKGLDEWAKNNGIIRLELTVECANESAKHLYEKNGFVIEGRREKSMKINGELVDEFYMAKII